MTPSSEMIHRRIELSTHGKGSLGYSQGMNVIQHIGCNCPRCIRERINLGVDDGKRVAKQ